MNFIRKKDKMSDTLRTDKVEDDEEENKLRIRIAEVIGWTIEFDDFRITITAPKGVLRWPWIESSLLGQDTVLLDQMCDVRGLNKKTANRKRLDRIIGSGVLHNYLHSLDAIRSAVLLMPEEFQRAFDYYFHDVRVQRHVMLWGMTAADWCKAFVRTLDSINNK